MLGFKVLIVLILQKEDWILTGVTVRVTILLYSPIVPRIATCSALLLHKNAGE